MIAIVWEFRVREESISAFQQAYGPSGDWAVLFRQYPGFQGTTLLQDSATSTRFLTIDHWTDREHFNVMRQGSRQEYSRLDDRCSELTVSERELGVFAVA
jgi:heme-degrading monooxygenase HmoA